MALTLNAVVGGASANSYVTLAEAIAYFEARLATQAWDSNTALHERALVAATARLDQCLFVGLKANTTQRLKWPRVGVRDDDDRAVEDDIIPQNIKDAQCEIALYLLAGNDTDRLAPTGLEPFSSITAGDVTLNLRDDAAAGGALPAQVHRYLTPYLEPASVERDA